MTSLQITGQLILAALIVVGYVVLTALHDDATALLALLGGQALGVGIQVGAGKASDSSG